MDYVYIVSPHNSDGSFISFFVLPHDIYSALAGWCLHFDDPCIVFAYRFGSLSREEFMEWDAHYLTEFDVVQFEFENNVSLFK